MAYKGQVAPFPVATLGFNGSKNPSRMSPGHMSYVDGLDINGGLLRKEGGASHYNSSALVSGSTVIISGVSWVPTPGTYHDIVFLSDGSARRDAASAGSFATTLVSGLTADRDPPAFFCEGGGEAVGSSRKMFMFTKSNPVKVVAGVGAAMATIATPPADWTGSTQPTFGVLHALRMWGGGNSNDPHRMYYSMLSNHENFTGAGSGSVAIYPGEGEGIIGGISYRGVMIVFKYPAGIYVLDTRDPTPANWMVNKLSHAVGGVNCQCIVQIDNDVVYLDASGNFHLLTATNELGDAETSNLSQHQDLSAFIRENINLSFIKRAVGIWYPHRRQAWFSVPGLTLSDNNIRIILDFSEPKVGPRFLLSRRDTVISMWTKSGTDFILRPMTGDTSGFVWLMDRDARNKNGVGYPVRIETAQSDLSFVDPMLAVKRKTVQFLELESEPIGTHFLTVEVYMDSILTDTVLFSMGSSGAALDTFVLDTDKLGGTDMASQRTRIAGSGRRIKLVAYNNNVNEDIALGNFFLSFKPEDERDAVA